MEVEMGRVWVTSKKKGSKRGRGASVPAIKHLGEHDERFFEHFRANMGGTYLSTGDRTR